MATYLDTLLDTARDRVAAVRDAGEAPGVLAAAEALAARVTSRRLRSALALPGVAVIAEVKRASPSKGDLAPGIGAVTQAQRYLDGGAAAISVLTEPSRFKGNLADLNDITVSTGAIALRKDFVVDELMIHEAVIAGASGVLLIVAALTDDQLAAMHAEATRLHLDVLVEVHGEGEVERALAVGADIIGVNARNLATFELDRDAFGRIRAGLPSGVLSVAESGVRGPEDVRRARDEGADAVLVGEFVVTSADPTATVAALVAAGKADA
jgi:indole-3-glycerol phosphate synthase